MATTLYDALQQAKTEEDIKDAYIKALNLKKYSKNIIDIQTDEIWFEAKVSRTTPIAMFAQLLYYVRDNKKKGENIPPFLSVIDREQAAILKTEKILPILSDKAINWSKSASQVTPENIKQIQPYIEKHFILFEIKTHEKEFIEAVKNAIETGDFIRTDITPDNLRIVFDKWVAMIGVEIEGVSASDYALLFFADIMFDDDHRKTSMDNLPARLLFDGEKPLFVLDGKNYELSTLSGYRRFWQIFHRPPDKEHRAYLLERRDSLLPIDERSFKGAFYTPLKVVEKAYELLTETLGKNWQEKYIIWDMCCGVGNLEVKHSNYRNIYMSTLDKADINVMKASKTCIGAVKFQYDYLNDDISDNGEIDYSITNKVPKELQQAIADAKAKKKGAKKILVLMNPPYAEATNADNTAVVGGVSKKTSEIKNKPEVAKTIFAKTAMADYGKASNELFTQFVARINQEIPNATLAMFSKLKYVNAPNFEKFRKVWKAKYLNGFVVHSKAFDGLNGNFPIGFLIWDSAIKFPFIEGVDAQADGVVKEIAPSVEIIPHRYIKSKKILSTLKKNELPFDNTLKEKARALRQAGNLSEVLLWQKLNKKQLCQLDFDRQRIIGHYIVDFYCHQCRLVVEIDGGSHNQKFAYDTKRDEYLSSLGINILHIADRDVRQSIHQVMATLMVYVNELMGVGSAKKLPRQASPATPSKKGNLIQSNINAFTEINTKVLNKDSEWIGEKSFYNLPNSSFLNVWIDRPRANKVEVIPLKNAISPYSENPRVLTWSDGAVAYMWCLANDMQNVGQQTSILSSVRGGGNGFYVNKENLHQAAIVFTVRQVIKHTWINHNDQFLQPTGKLSDEFKHDCLIYMLFAGKNLTASADNLEWNNKKWSIVNHFIPFTEKEVNANGKFASDFMVQYLKGKVLSAEAKAVLIAGKSLWQAYFNSEFEKKIRDELKLNRPDVGWYQIRNALKANNANGNGETNFSGFETAYKNLSEKLRPMVYELGFLR